MGNTITMSATLKLTCLEHPDCSCTPSNTSILANCKADWHLHNSMHDLVRTKETITSAGDLGVTYLGVTI